MYAPLLTHGPTLDAVSGTAPPSAPVADPSQTSLHKLPAIKQSEKTIAAVGYTLLSVTVFSLCAWTARDLMWILASFGVTRALGSVTAFGTLVLAMTAGLAMSLPLRPFKDGEQWEKAASLVAFTTWFLSATWMLLGL